MVFPLADTSVVHVHRRRMRFDVVVCITGCIRFTVATQRSIVVFCIALTSQHQFLPSAQRFCLQ